MKKTRTMKKYDCVVSLSGGIDTTTLVYFLVKKKKKKPLCIYLDYGAVFAKKEIRLARRTCRKLGVGFRVIDFSVYKKIADCQMFKKPKGKIRKKKMMHWLEGRNCIITLVLGVIASNIGAKEVYMGVHKSRIIPWEEGYYPDSTPECYRSLNDVFKYGFSKKVVVRTPFIEMDMNKVDIIRMGERLGVDWDDTTSCCVSEEPCGKCEACFDRIESFKAAGVNHK